MLNDRSKRSAQRTAAVLAMAFLAAPVGAQVRAGGHALYKSQAFDGTFGVGARAEVDLGFVRRGLVIAGIYDRLFPDCDDCSSSEFGGQILLAPQGPIYFGLGVGYRQYERSGAQAAPDDTRNWNYSFAAGLRLTGLPVIVPFLEYRQEFAGTLNEQTFALGVLLSPTGSRAAPRRPLAR